ncbi:hypothetical protein VNO77_09851 [Canavalia gladiata]|uniref:Uncharacterized protein n=1 Tax=Canavalia gladiata TaxID=3824 RepID=A0AAN9M9L1_CANGL
MLGPLMYVVLLFLYIRKKKLFNLYINSFSCYHLCFPRIFKVLSHSDISLKSPQVVLNLLTLLIEVQSPTWVLRIKDSCGSHIPSHSYQNDTRRVSDTWANGSSGSVGNLTLQRRLCDTMPSLSGPASIDPKV